MGRQQNIKATSYKYKMKKSETLLIFLLVCVIDGIEATGEYEGDGYFWLLFIPIIISIFVLLCLCSLCCSKEEKKDRVYSGEFCNKVRGQYCGDWVPKIRVPKGNTQTRIKFWVWVGLGLCLKSMGIFGLGTHKVLLYSKIYVLLRFVEPFFAYTILVNCFSRHILHK